MSNRRALHFVLKVGNLKNNVEFFRNKLGMTVLRHEVFERACEAACNGPYDSKWSKTMIGYGPEDDHFVLELTYNYTTGSYKRGNDLQYIKLALNKDSFAKVKDDAVESDETNALILNSPDGYKFLVCEQDSSNSNKQDVTEVCLSCVDLSKTLDYWMGLLKMHRHGNANDAKEAWLKYADDQASLKFKQIDEDIDHKSAYGRVAFSCPSDELKPIQRSMEEAGQKILTPYLSLETPGKATVQVVILADPDGHEICFVGDEGFRELSQIDTDANEKIEKSMAEDKSDEWYKRKNKSKNEE